MYITLFVDGVSLQRRADPITVSEELGDAITYYVDQIDSDGLPVSRRRAGGPAGKGFILSASRRTRQACRHWAVRLGLEVKSHSDQPGVDSAGGKHV